PFERLRDLLANVQAPELPIVDFSIGEPRRPAPALVVESIIEHLHGLASYPKVLGSEELRRSIVAWAEKRFALPAGFLDSEQNILPANGSREALFSAAQALVDPTAGKDLILQPNPFYQIYEGAALLAGATPYYLNCTSAGQPDYRAIPADIWQRCALMYVNSPHNPTGAALSAADWDFLVAQARRYRFVLAADECYSEIYFDTPPPGVLSAAARSGSLAQVLAFHSLSKRSSIPGARSGFIAGDAALLSPFRLFRTYLGNAMPPFIQAASAAAWSDEQHVALMRADYADKFALAAEILGDLVTVERPAGGFYLWLAVGDGEAFTRNLFAQQAVRCLPGAYLARPAHGSYPGRDRVRIALVGEQEICREGLLRIRQFLLSSPIN
ncbi:MAG: succinyldiaminopimelate transaminase, partial [Candidatus Igneacidithiobacillus chanchocoensis]